MPGVAGGARVGEGRCPMTGLRIGAGSFNVAVDGDPSKPPLVLCHALGADLTMWDAQMAAFTARFRVVRYDARGHGGSGVPGVPGAPVSVAGLGRDALAILDALDIAKAHWVGASMGGAVVQWLLVNAPGRVERAVLATTASRLGTPDLWNGRIGAALAHGMEHIADATMERWFGAAFAERSAHSVAAVHERMRQTSPKGYAACCAALRDMDLRRGLEAVEAPVLVITGTDDEAVSPAATAALLEAIAGARHVAFSTRHMPNIEAADAFAEAVITFLTAADEPSVRAPRGAASARSAAVRTTKAARTVPRTKVGPPKPTAKARAARRPPMTNAARNGLKDVGVAIGGTTAPAKTATGARTGARTPDRTKSAGTTSAKTAAAKTTTTKTKRAARIKMAKKGAATAPQAPPDPMPPPRREPKPNRPSRRRKP